MEFAFDDSQITIGDIPHTIIAGIGVHDPIAMSHALAKLKLQFGLSSEEEVKWNGMKLEQREREALSQELLVLLNEGASVVTIREGLDRQVAAQDMTYQLADYFASHQYQLERSPGLSMVFDEGIISDRGRYDRFLRGSFSSPVSEATFESVESHTNALVQLADVLAGFNRLLTEISLGRPDKELEIMDDGLGMPIKMNLHGYICLSQRWNVWGEVPPPPDPQNVAFDGRWPFKHVGGHGLRINSSIPAHLVKQIYDSRIVYMGCMH